MPLGDGPASVAIGDINDDGNRDLAVANRVSDDVSVLLGNGAGGFSTAPGTPVPTGGLEPRSVAIGNLDGDTRPDLAISNFESSDVSILLGKDAGGFSPAPGSPMLTGGANANAVAIANLNGDAYPDLVIPNPGSGDVSILLGDGAGGFTLAAGSPVSTTFSFPIAGCDREPGQ